jgi:hypothetical protein
MELQDAFKIRISNSAKKLGKSKCFLLYFVFDKAFNSITFLALIYKERKQGKERSSDRECKQVLNDFHEERNAGRLIPLDLSSGSIEFLEKT